MFISEFLFTNLILFLLELWEFIIFIDLVLLKNGPFIECVFLFFL